MTEGFIVRKNLLKFAEQHRGCSLQIIKFTLCHGRFFADAQNDKPVRTVGVCVDSPDRGNVAKRQKGNGVAVTSATRKRTAARAVPTVCAITANRRGRRSRLSARLRFCILPYAEVSIGDPHLGDPPKPVKRGLSLFYGVNLFYARILLLIIPQICEKAKKKPPAFVQNSLKSAEAARPLQRVYKLRGFSEKSFRKLWKSLKISVIITDG